MKKLLMVGVLLAVAGACLSRRPAEVGSATRKPPRKERSPAVAIRSEADPVRRSAEELQIGRVEEFTAAAQEAAAILHRAQERRQRELSAPSPEVQVSIDSDLAYESECQAALARLEPFLDHSAAHRMFRENLETWASTVWTRSHRKH